MVSKFTCTFFCYKGQSSDCLAVGGPGNGLPCVFPFKYGKITYTTCSNKFKSKTNFVLNCGSLQEKYLDNCYCQVLTYSFPFNNYKNIHEKWHQIYPQCCLKKLIEKNKENMPKKLISWFQNYYVRYLVEILLKCSAIPLQNVKKL